MKSKDPIQYIFPSDGTNLSAFTEKTHQSLGYRSPVVIEFLRQLSKVLLNDVRYNAYGDLVSLGYWLRPKNIEKIFGRVANEGVMFAPRGLALHIAPSNVDTIFVYSLVLSLIAGNRNIVRLSSKESPEKLLILDALRQAVSLCDSPEISDSILVISYPHDDEISKNLSSLADVRVIWGGDHTVSYFSSLPSKVSVKDIKFVNKYSLSVIDSAQVSKLDEVHLASLAAKFVKDAYTFGQQGCSSPRAVVWLKSVDRSLDEIAKSRFWACVQSHVDNSVTELVAADYVEKVVYAAARAIKFSDSINSTAEALGLIVVDTDISLIIDESSHCGRGVFLQCQVANLAEISSHLTSSVQTITYYGISTEDVQKWLESGVKGIDRVVPIGEALTFDVIWDGVNILTENSRMISVA